MTSGWQEIEHTADWAILVWADTLEALFEQTARGMTMLLGGRLSDDHTPLEESVHLTAMDLETLLIDWLTEMLILIEEDATMIEHLQITQIDTSTMRLDGIISGRRPAFYETHIKAATYHKLEIQQTERGYETTIVFDV